MLNGGARQVVHTIILLHIVMFHAMVQCTWTCSFHIVGCAFGVFPLGHSDNLPK